MIGLLLWLLVAVGFVYELTARAMWHDVLAAMLGAGFVLWVFGGATIFAMRQAGMFEKPKRPVIPQPVPPNIAAMASHARQQAQGEGK